MRLLLDTHALIWSVGGHPRLGDEARDLIADRDNEVLFSIVSIWEILIKHRAGKLLLDWRKLVAAAASGFRRIDLALPHAAAFAALPIHHRDPFDHMILAQAIAEQATLVTADRIMRLYGVAMIECG